MKKYTVLSVLLCLLFAIKLSAQDLDIDLKNASQSTIYKEIEKQSVYMFIYESRQISKVKNRDFKVKGPIQKVMYELFKNSILTYTETKDNYFIIKENVNRAADNKHNKEAFSDMIDVHGWVTNESGEPIAHATVYDNSGDKYTITDTSGQFVLTGIDRYATLAISCISYEQARVRLKGTDSVQIRLKLQPKELNVVLVSVGYTGYRAINREKEAGSYSIINNTLFNRKVSSQLLDRIENLAPGLSFNNPVDGLLLRGKSTIYANANPLVILDNFPYTGDISNINPNDVESITILNDATAASIWGAMSGNGVIVITTKKGTTSKVKVEAGSNFTIQPRPDLSRLHWMRSDEAVDLQKYFYEKGYYKNDILSSTTLLPPVVEILLKKDSMKITDAEALAQLNQLRSQNVYDDLENYFYQPAALMQHYVNFSVNTEKINSFSSFGWDNSSGSLLGQRDDRITLKNRQAFSIQKDLKITVAQTYTNSIHQTLNNPGIGLNSGEGKGLLPYADLVDHDGNALTLVKDLRPGYTDTAGGGKLLDWKYRPYEDLFQGSTTGKSHDLLLNIDLDYQFNDWLSISLKYQLENAWVNGKVQNNAGSYLARDLHNRFYQPGSDNPHKVPNGNITDVGNSYLRSHQGRVQLNYNRSWTRKHALISLAGWEIKENTFNSESYRLYYDISGAAIRSKMDFETPFRQYNNTDLKLQIPNPQGVSAKLDRSISFFTNASYTYDGRFTISVSGRTDAANLLGSSMKAVPLWSAGAKWMLSKERFFTVGWLTDLSIRGSVGYKGNFFREASARTTIDMMYNDAGIAEATVLTPANKKLRWEKMRMINLGVDFKMGPVVSGRFECYWKKATDVLAKELADGTSGLSQPGPSGGKPVLFGNGAATKGNGFELELNSRNINGAFKWFTSFIFSHTENEIAVYSLPAPDKGRDYTALTINPVVGRPLYSIYSYQWGGLNDRGDPVGYLGKNSSTDWNSIINQTKPDSMIYNGPAQYPSFGSIRNSFTWKNWNLSVMISFKTGSFFRKNSISYSNAAGTWTGHSDYALRWQNPGDENNTNVPAPAYSNSPQWYNRDQFYQQSEINVLKGDHIRFEDIRLEYSFYNKKDNAAFSQLKVYGYVSNLGIIWTANKERIDPYYPDGNIYGKKFSLGINVTF